MLTNTNENYLKINIEHYNYLEKHPNFTGKLWDVNNTKVNYVNGMLHSENYPAVIKHNIEKIWCKEGIRHREDGPAIECVNGHKEWWLNGWQYDNEQKYKIALRKIKLERILKKINE